ncbi:unnamed protein product [Caenorhabditis angaria]|uniref:BTB domain-containing protein n=1 Tax=Caenorhabditis angaria TaxID=860376 RepID=A0A9P1I530_9PELO|nr:unnamed protein product [Caenorhabditis angaria]
MEIPAKRSRIEAISTFPTNPILTSGIIRWKFENLAEWDGSMIYSDVLEIDQFKWKIGVQKKEVFRKEVWREENVVCLSVHLFFIPDDKNNKSWLLKINGTRRLLKQNDTSRQYSIDFAPKSCFTHDFLESYICPFKDWEFMRHEGFLINHSIIIENEMDIAYYDFSEKNSDLSNIKLYSSDRTKFYFNKEILCHYSKYFYNMFYVENCEKKKKVLHDIERTQLTHFLATCCPIPLEIREESYKFLMEMAEKFDVPSLHLKCEQYLIEHEKMDIIDKLVYVEKYGYEKLLKICANSFRSAEEVKNLGTVPKFKEISQISQLKILKSVLKFFHLDY